MDIEDCMRCWSAADFPYSIFGIGVDRKHTLKWLFPQEKATYHGTEKVYMYSENALIGFAIA